MSVSWRHKGPWSKSPENQKILSGKISGRKTTNICLFKIFSDENEFYINPLIFFSERPKMVIFVHVDTNRLTLKRPLRKKLRVRWFFDVFKVKESSFFLIGAN